MKGEKYDKENFTGIGCNQKGTPGYQTHLEVPLFRKWSPSRKRKSGWETSY